MIFKNLFYNFLFYTTLSLFQKEKSSIHFLEVFFNNIQSLNIREAKNDLEKIKDNKLYEQLSIYFDVKSNNGYQLHKSTGYIDKINLQERIVNLNFIIDILILTEDAILYKNDRITSFDLARKGYKLSESVNNSFFQTQFILKILKIYTLGIVSNDNNVNFYLEKLLELNKNNNLYQFKYFLYKIYLNEIGLLYGDNQEKLKDGRVVTEKNLKNLEKISNLIDKKNNLLIEYYHLKGLSELPYQNFKRAHSFFEKELNLLRTNNEIFFNKLKYENLKESSRVYSLENKFIKAKQLLEKSQKFQSKLTILKNNFIYNLYISDIYYGLNKKDSAYISLKTAFHSSLKLNFKDQNSLISSLEIKNKTKEKEQQILISETKREQNKNLLIIALALLILVATIALLTLKNSRKKRQLAEQQKRLEQQKNITLLKEQEINAINAMVEGQEKERKQIAEDLHDNIGSVLATLKLHFENLKLNRKKKHFNQEELYDKTEKLIDETYFKIRSIAHAKNSGVIANQGLLNAVKMMAEKISSANKTQIEVIDFGLNTKLDDALEISTFRIIQELTTNIIKHSEAQNATINISQFKDNLNIIIEDNGKGFNTDKINLKNGMGLSSITTRIEYLKGTINIDSSIGNGTSVIINLPLVNG